MKKDKKGALVSVAVLAIVMSASTKATYAEVTRQSGNDRYAVADKIVDTGWSNANVAIIASGEDVNLVDSLTAAPLAKRNDCPMIFTKPGKELPMEVMTKLNKLGVRKVYIASGKKVFGDEVIKQLNDAGISNVVRLGGADRFETALNIATEIGQANGIVVAAANDKNIVDSLSIASIAAVKNMPIFLSDKEKLDDRVFNYIKNMNVKTSYVIGGTGIVSNNILFSLPGTQKRLFGSDRYETNCEILKEFRNDEEIRFDKKIYITSGDDKNLFYPLACAPLAAKNYAPIVLADNSITENTKKLIGDKINTTTDISVIGNESIVKVSIEDELKNIQKSANLQIASVYPQKDNTLKVVLSKQPEVTPVLPDFKIRVKYGTSGEQDIYPTNLMKDSSDINGCTYILTLPTLSSVVAEQDIIYSVDFRNTGFKNADKYNVLPDFIVRNIELLNLKQIQITFSRPVDKITAENPVNYLVYDKNSTTIFPGKYKPTLQADNKTLILTLDTSNTNALTHLSTAKVIVKKDIKDATGAFMTADYVKNDLNVVDVARPTVISAEQIALNKIKVCFSEPVKDLDGGMVCAANNFLIDNGSYIITAVKLDTEKRTAELTLSGSLIKGNHTLTVNPNTNSDLADFGNNKFDMGTNITFSTANDTSAPVAIIKNVSQTSVTFTFNKPINYAKHSNIAYRHTMDGNSYQVSGSSPYVVINDERTQVTVNFAEAKLPIPLGNTMFYISYVNSSAGSTFMTDDFGNKFEPMAISANVVEDKTKPTAAAALVDNSNNKIDVTFSKSVVGATNASNYVLKDVTGNTIPFSITSVGNNTYRLKTYKELGGVYSLRIKGIKDSATTPNIMDEYVTAINVSDTVPPYIVDEAGNQNSTLYYYYQNDDKNVRIYFSEQMNASDLATLTMYQNVGNNNAFPISAVPSSDGKSVYLTFNSPVIGNIMIGQLSDMAGNKIKSIASILSPTKGANPGLNPGVGDKVEAIDNTVVRVYVNELLQSINASDFEINRDGSSNWVTPIMASMDNVDNKYVVTLVLDQRNAIAKNQWDIGRLPQVRTVSSPGIQGSATMTKTAFGTRLNINSVGIVDKIAPKLSDYNPIQRLDVDNNGITDHIKITFSEKIHYNSVSKEKFSIGGYNVIDAFTSTTQPTSATSRNGANVVSANEVYVTVAEQFGDNNNTVIPSVSIEPGLTDLNGNQFANQ